MMRGCSRWYKKWLRLASNPTSTPQYRRGAVASVMPKVARLIAASTREMRHSPANMPGLISPVMAVTTTAASTACGTWCSAGSSHSSTTSTSEVAKTVAHPLWAPAYKLMAERENDALVAKPPHRPELIFAMPCATRSWFSFQRVPPLWWSTLALDAVSRKLTSVTTSTGRISEPSVLQGRAPGQ